MNKTISAAFRKDLIHIDSFITCNSNIETVNSHVNTTTSGLVAREEAVDDLLSYLFISYKIASDVKFVAFIDMQ